MSAPPPVPGTIITELDPPIALGANPYRRRIRVWTEEPGVVVSALEDDFHHFVVTIGHDGAVVRTVGLEAHRWPWDTCPHGVTELQRLVGMPLAERFTAAGAWTPASRNCTHQFDAASHAITHAAHRRLARQYDVEVTAHFGRADHATDPGQNRLWVDGRLDLTWTVRPGHGLVDPAPPFDAAPWRGGFMRWADSTLDPDAAERAIVLRRACDIGMGRGMPLDDIPVATDLLATMGGVCFTMQPEIAPGGHRNEGSIRDFGDDPSELTTDPAQRRHDIPVIRRSPA